MKPFPLALVMLMGLTAIMDTQQFRICFKWEDGHAYEVEIVDYH
jgi:plasmid maintenance system killer protein